jgi:hypothetical protein
MAVCVRSGKHMNYIKLNLKAKEIMEAEYETNFKDLMTTELDRMSYFRTILYNLSKGRAKGCSKCGSSITQPNLHFYDYDVEKVKCYNCQHIPGFEN